MHSRKVAKKLGTAALTGALSLGVLAGETIPFFGTTVYAAEEKTQAEDGAASSADKKDDSSKDDSSKGDSGNKGNDSSKDDSGNKKDDSSKDDSGNKKDDSSKDDSGNKGDDGSKDDSGNKGDDSSKDNSGNKGDDASKGDSSDNKGNGSSDSSDKKNDSSDSSSSSKTDETNKPSSSTTDETKPSGSSSGLPETTDPTNPGGSSDVVQNPDASKLPETTEDENKDDENLSDEDELKREEEIANEEDDDDGEGNEELISHQTIIHLPDLEEDFRFFTVARVYGFAKDKLYIYEEMSEKAEKVGELKKSGLVYILKTENDGWYYVESGDVRGFVKKDKLYTGDKAQEMLKNFQTQAKALADRRGKEYTGISHLAGTATALVDWTENDAFTYYRGTTGQTVVDKVYALALTKTTVRDSKSDKGKAVGKMEKDALCYVIADRNQEWVYIESGKVRGFVKKEDLQIATIANQLAAKITQKGSSSYETASQSVDPDKNKALYYTRTSIKSGSQKNSIRSELLKYAAQYAGNPYKWGGSSLTHGTDCSGFAMRVYQKFGYKLPRTSRAQSHCGTKVAVEDARPGDLIFYAKKGHVYHVAIYAGNGKTIEAANEKLGICSLRANRKNAVWAVHLIKDENETAITETSINEANTTKKDQGKLLGDYKITYYSPEETESEKAGSVKDTTSTLIEGNTVAVSEIVAKEGEELIINGHLYTATNSKTDVAEDEMAIYVSSTEKEQTLTESTASVYKAKS